MGNKEQEPQEKEIDRSRFMYLLEQGQQTFEVQAERGRTIYEAAIKGLQRIYSIREGVRRAEESGLRVRFFEDEKGFKYTIEQKPPLGFNK